MRHLLTIITAFAVLCTLAGCGGDARSDRLAAAQQAKVLRIGVKADNPPFGAARTAGGFRGFDVDIAAAIAERLGCTPEFSAVTSADRFARLADGSIDLVVATTTITRSRERLADFSVPYFQDGQALLVRTGSGIAGYQALAQRRVGAVTGSTSLDTMKQVAPEAEVIGYPTLAAARDDLLAGKLDAITSDAFILMGLRQGEPRLSFAGGRFSTEPYGVAMAQGQSALRDAVNEALMELWDSGQWRAIYDTWFGPGTPFATEIRFAVPVVPR